MTTHTHDEELIRKLVETWAAAVRARDMPAILRHHARDVIMFDVPPPLVVRGLEHYEQTWDLFYSASPSPPPFDIQEMHVTAGAEVAFVVALMRCALLDDNPAGSVPLDFRLTWGLRKIDGHWTIIHEHHSVPADD